MQNWDISQLNTILQLLNYKLLQLQAIYYDNNVRKHIQSGNINNSGIK